MTFTVTMRDGHYSVFLINDDELPDRLNERLSIAMTTGGYFTFKDTHNVLCGVNMSHVQTFELI